MYIIEKKNENVKNHQRMERIGKGEWRGTLEGKLTA
jgi:hypothetical protein